MTPGRAEDEVGEELTLADRAQRRGQWATFYAGLRKVTFFARIRSGKLFDDLNHQIHVCRWKDPNEEKCPAS